MSRIKPEEILTLCAALFNVNVEEVKGMRAPGWREKYHVLKPSSLEKAQCAAMYLINKHTPASHTVILRVMGFKQRNDMTRVLHCAEGVIRPFKYELSRIEQSIDRIHELRISLEEANYDCSQVPCLRGKVFG